MVELRISILIGEYACIYLLFRIKQIIFADIIFNENTPIPDLRKKILNNLANKERFN